MHPLLVRSSDQAVPAREALVLHMPAPLVKPATSAVENLNPQQMKPVVPP